MKKITIIVSALVAVSSVGAFAADMPLKAPPPAVAVYSWTGFYVGVSAGGNWGHSDPITYVAHVGDYFGTCGPPVLCVDPVNAAGKQSLKTSGFTGGVQGGYNLQLGNIVAGIEADFEYFRSAGSTSATRPTYSTNTDTVFSSVSTDWLFTLRPRLGVALNNWLFYGTGGLAVTKLNASWGFTDSFVGGGRESVSVSETKIGWVAGGGIETALFNNWLIGCEYLYMRFNDISGSGKIVANDDVLNHSSNLSASIVRARVSKKF
jgi:outer membrane immunogenic protein